MGTLHRNLGKAEMIVIKDFTVFPICETRISYANQDRERVKSIYQRLNSYAVSVFWDRKKLKHGLGFPAQITKRLLKSRHFVLLCSEHTKSSAWVAHIQNVLLDKNCIVVGSPDVNDFAEVLISTMHSIDPYTRGRKKKKGFAIIKKRELTTSSFYWQIEGQEQEGIAEILEDGQYEYFPHKTARNSEEIGEMHGVLVIGNNPFSTAYSMGKVVVLSGFSGVATNAIAKLLTVNEYLKEYFKFGRRFPLFDKNVEVLVKVEYKVGNSSMDRDTRSIENVSFEKLFEI